MKAPRPARFLDGLSENPRGGVASEMKTHRRVVRPLFSIPTSPTTSGYKQIIYQIKLAGPAILGEGKPENQNHAIIFTHGEGLQTIDMNQDNYMEEALKMRNLLQEFLKRHDLRHLSILGMREHMFTGSTTRKMIIDITSKRSVTDAADFFDTNDISHKNNDSLGIKEIGI